MTTTRSPGASGGSPFAGYAALIPADTRVLALGEARAITGQLRERGCQVTERDEPEGLEPGEEPFDAAVAIGFLEHQQWDRWTLQRIHRRLKNGGLLLLAVPNLLAPLSPGAIGYVGAKAAHRAARIAARALGRRPPPPAAFATRRYRLAQLTKVLGSLGYELESCRPHASGLLTPLAGSALLLPFWGAWILLCRRRPSLFGLDTGRPYPDAEQHRRAFEIEHRRFLEIRDGWIARNPRFRPAKARPLDVASFRGRNILVLSPHPDDEIIGCGGTLSKLIAAGARVTVIQATDGGDAAALADAPAAARKTVRLEESRAVSRAIGFSEVIFWNEDNAAFRARDEVVERLRGTLESLRPALVFVPFVTDIHPDHVVLNHILARALETASVAPDATQVVAYEVWGFVPANLTCDVTDVMRKQEELLLLYPTAMKVDDFVHLCEARNYYNCWALSGVQGFAEAFFTVPAEEYRGIVAAAGKDSG